MEDLLKLRDIMENFLSEVNEELGSERVQPYICILEGVVKGINTDLDSN